MNKTLSEYAELYHKFKIEELGVFDTKECKQSLELRKKIESALSLQELAQKRIKYNLEIKNDIGGKCEFEELKTLQSLIKESQNFSSGIGN